MDLIEREKILHGDEGEDEEDDLIVYKEQTEVPFCLSQPSTVTNTRAENRGSYPYPVAASKSRMSRYERRKRRHRWQERQQYPKTAPTPETPMVELDNDDPFAALQSLLGGPSQSQDTEKENHTFREERNKRSPARQMCLQQTTKPDVEMQPQHASSQQEKHRPVPEQQRDDIAEGMELSQSQPDFIFFDGDVDEEENDTGTLEEHFTRSRRDSSYQPRTKKERNEKMKKARKSAPAGILPEPEFVGPQSSRMKRGSKRSEGKSHKTKTQSSVPQQNQLTTTQVKISRSIVGSRPTGWARNSPKPGKATSSSLKPTSRLKQLARSHDLAAATRRPMSHMGPARLSPPKTPRQSRNSEDTSMTVSNTNLRPAEPTKTKPPRPISFAPSFAPALSKKNVDQVVDSEDVQFVNTIPNSASKFTSPPSHKRRGRYSKRGGKGRLATRLANLCNVRANDAVKLQNPAFSRHCSAFDLNHPRHRAKSHTDLMILGDYPYPWVNTADRDSNMTVLGHIYQHVRSDKKPRHEGELAWVTFTMATARSVKLQKGSQLRLYNSAIIPSRKSVVITDNATEDLNSNGCKLIILCTDLCEPYELNPLPRVGCTENNASTAKE